MTGTSLLSKLTTSFSNGRVRYFMEVGPHVVALHHWIGQRVQLEFTGKRVCQSCRKEVPLFYRMGYCKPCFFSDPGAGDAILHPEKSLAHLGIADRDLAVEQAYQIQPHVVYLAHTGGVKVGVTGARYRWNRWMDQGADKAVVVARTENRFDAGQMEVFLKDYFSDKTQWQWMVTNRQDSGADLRKAQETARAVLTDTFQSFLSSPGQEEVVHLQYPVSSYPMEPKSTGFDNNPCISGILTGIRGQYLLFKDGSVFNVRSHEGYEAVLTFSSIKD